MPNARWYVLVYTLPVYKCPFIWFVYVQCTVQKGWVKVNIDQWGVVIIKYSCIDADNVIVRQSML